MILFISNSGDGLPIAYRMWKEGSDVRVYIHNQKFRHNYDGILLKVTINQLRKMVDLADLVIFDMARVNEKTQRDIVLLKIFGIDKNSTSVFGAIADKIKTKVIGASEFTESLEMDRAKGTHIAKQIGLRIPKTYKFSDKARLKKFLSKNKGLWVLKPNNNEALDLTYVEKFSGELLLKLDNDLAGRITGEVVLQEKIDGVEVSTEGWWNGKNWQAWNHTIESKRLMNGDNGIAVGSQVNTVWMNKGFLVKEMSRLGAILKKAGYIGPIDINCIVNEKPYFLEFSPRFGYDAIYNLFTLLDGKITDFFKNDFTGKWKKGYSCSQRVSIPPYPYENDELLDQYAKDVPIKGKLKDFPDFWMEDIQLKAGQLRCAGADGIIGVVAKRGSGVKGAFGAVQDTIDGLGIGAYLQYRTDGAEAVQPRIDALSEVGIG